MTTLVIYRGLPGSGKTTHAIKEITSRPRGSAARINRDDFRRHIFRTRYVEGDPLFEDLVTVLQHAAIQAALCNGVDVLCDDTNLHPEHCALLMRVASSCNADWTIRDFTHVDLETCVNRDRYRDSRDYVGESVIRGMYEKHAPRGWAPMPVPELTPRER